MTTILRVAVPSPLRQLFDYLPPAAVSSTLRPGARLRVPFGRREVIGVLMAIVDSSDVATGQLRAAIEIIDDEPVLSASMLALIGWAADYYQHPLGECVANALPVLLRKGEAVIARATQWRLAVSGLALPSGALKRAPQQAQVLALLQQYGALTAAQIKEHDISTATLRAMLAKELVERFETSAPPSLPSGNAQASTAPIPTLTDEQCVAVDAVAKNAGVFRCHLLEGVTGSGKTEVYLRLIEQARARGEQALVLVPEIGLTPQTLSRFQQRLASPVVALHSGLNDSERLDAWRAARSGAAGVLLGTRSAVFAEFARLGLIIIDEEHDASYKQQDGFRYSARDIAIKRAADLHIPIVLGSATPSLETLHNALSGRYTHLQLHARAGGAAQPQIELLDIRHAPMRDGLAPRVFDAIGTTLQRGEQALVFLNRRGFAPTLLCHDCGWIAQCAHCDTRLTVHAGMRQLRCHHCEYRQPLARICPSCKSPQLEFRGPGTERLEIVLLEVFRDTPVIRIDRDTTQRKHALQEKIDAIKQQQPCILVGTQMLAKGHHFPAVTLVVMVDIDGALFSADLRGPERMGQVLTQVAGRAGRAEKAGRVLVQTHYPEHELINDLVSTGYHDFARKLLNERRVTGAPPFAHFALLRADARAMADAEQVLAAIREHLTAVCGLNSGVQMFGPLPAPLSRRAGMFRAQLLLNAPQRAPLHRAVQAAVNFAEQLPAARRVKWSIDIDPIDFS